MLSTGLRGAGNVRLPRFNCSDGAAQVQFVPESPLAVFQSSTGKSASPAQVLYTMMSGRQTGKLTVRHPQEAGVNWQVFVGNGQVHFATCSVGQFERLSYLRRCSQQAVASHQSDYQFLCSQWRSGLLTLRQLRAILTLMTQDAVVQVLKMPEAMVSIENPLGLDPLLISVPIPQLLAPARAELLFWRKASEEILSPLQRPLIMDRVQWYRLLHAPRRSPILEQLAPCLERGFCLYQIAQQINVSVVDILPFIQNLLRRGVIEMRPYLPPPILRPTIACIDASLEAQCAVKTVLEAIGYHVLSLRESRHIWSSLAQYQPKLLLVDVDHFEGYSLMKALQRTEQFQNLPMVALTERQGLVHRFRSLQAGATDCLSKPVDPSALCRLTEYISEE